MAGFASTAAAFQPVVTQVKAEMAPLGQDTHGKLIPGRLTLTGRIKRVDPRADPQSADSDTFAAWGF